MSESLFYPFFLPLLCSRVSIKSYFEENPFLNSLQQVTLTIPINETLINVTINPVDVNYSIPIFLNCAYGGTDARQGLPYVVLVNSTTLRLQRHQASATYTVTANVFLVEVNPLYIKPVQTANITIAAGQTYGETTITAVDLNKTFLVYRGCNLAVNDTLPNWLSYLSLVNSTTVRATRVGTNQILYPRATVVELK